MKLDFNGKKFIFPGSALHNALLNKSVTGDIKEEIRQFLEANSIDNTRTTYQYVCNRIYVIRGKFITVSH